MFDTRTRRMARAADVAERELRDMANAQEARWRAETADECAAETAEHDARTRGGVHIHADTVVVAFH